MRRWKLGDTETDSENKCFEDPVTAGVGNQSHPGAARKSRTCEPRMAVEVMVTLQGRKREWRDRERWAQAQSRTDSLNRKGVPKRGCLVDVMHVMLRRSIKRVVMKLGWRKGSTLESHDPENRNIGELHSNRKSF